MIHRGLQTHLLWVWNNIQYKQEGTDRDLLLFDSSLKNDGTQSGRPCCASLAVHFEEKRPNKR